MIMKKNYDIIGTALKNCYFRLLRGNRKAVCWKPALKSYDQSRRFNAPWLLALKKKMGHIYFLKTGGRHLSRIERRKITRIRAMKAVGAVAISLLIFVGLKKPAYNFVVSLGLFQIKEITITGCRQLDQAQIKTIAGFDYNTSLFAAAPSQISTVLARHPWIKSTRVRRQWPDRISVEVEEHSINALLALGPQEEERLYYINKKGETIAPVQAGQDVDYPVITGVSTFSEDKRGEVLQDAIAFLKQIGSNDPNLSVQLISEIHIDKADGMIVHLVEFPFPIYFGKGEVKKKYKQLRKVLTVLYKKRNRKVDISQIEYIRMDYHENKVLVAQIQSG